MLKRIAVMTLCVLMISTGIFLTGCGGGGSSSVTDIQQTVTVGKRVYVDPSNIVFFGYRNLLCTARLEGTDISEFIVEAGFTGNIYALAVYNNELYVSASDGFFKYPLSMFESGEKTASAVTLMKDSLDSFNHFEISGDKIFFTYGYGLYYVPTEGGDKTKIADEVYDFEVSDKGIYYSGRDGSMHVMSPELDDEREIGRIAEEVRFNPGGANLYYRDGESLKAFSVEKEESEEVRTGNTLNKYYQPWSDGTNVLYSGEDYTYYVVSSGGEKDLGKSSLYPSKAEGSMYGSCLLSTDPNYSQMQLVDLEQGEVKTYDLEKELAEYTGQMGSGGSGGDGGSGGQSGTSSSAAYDIEKGGAKQASSDGSIVYIYFNDFMMIMPNNDKYGYEASGDSVTFFLVGARQDGFDGRLVTIKAYDMDDESYKEIPSYHVAGVGKNVSKRFIAIYPTDVQWNHEDAQQEADYKDLQTYLQKIGEGAVNSPLKTADSD